jgi:type I restriction enzyme M protein
VERNSKPTSTLRFETKLGPDANELRSNIDAGENKPVVLGLTFLKYISDTFDEHADTFRRDLYPDLRADFVFAHPLFNDSDRFRKNDDARWQLGSKPAIRGNRD